MIGAVAAGGVALLADKETGRWMVVAVVLAGVAGCETIWIVSHRETTPLLRHRLGDWIYDPVINPSIRRKYSERFNQQFKQIPIYYVPIHPKDRDVRDGLVWSIFYGIRKAYHISHYFSKWVTPNKYYVSFPYSVYTAGNLKEKRLDISSNQSLKWRLTIISII